MRGHFCLPLSLVLGNNAIGINRKTSVGIDSNTEKSRVSLKFKIKKNKDKAQFNQKDVMYAIDWFTVDIPLVHCHLLKVSENRRDKQEWIIQRHWQEWIIQRHWQEWAIQRHWQEWEIQRHWQDWKHETQNKDNTENEKR